MAGVAFITGKRYVDGQSVDVFYIGSVQGDGYTYFNDERMYRCKQDGGNLGVFYFPKQIWINSDNITEIKVLAFDVSGLLDTVAGIVGGGGSVSPNANVETAVQWAINKANTNRVTYSQSNRNLKNPDGWSYDCSSFMITSFYVGGFDINATYTGNMVAGFQAAGFSWTPMSYIPANILQRGDVMVKQFGAYGHTQMYIGNNQDVNCGATPANVCSHSPDNWGRGGWDGYLRYAG